MGSFRAFKLKSKFVSWNDPKSFFEFKVYRTLENPFQHNTLLEELRGRGPLMLVTVNNTRRKVKAYKLRRKEYYG